MLHRFSCSNGDWTCRAGLRNFSTLKGGTASSCPMMAVTVYQSDCSGRAGSSAARDQLFHPVHQRCVLVGIPSILRREGFSTLRGACSVRSGRLASRVSSAAIVSLRLSRRAARKKPAISSIGIRQPKTRLLCSDGFSAVVQMSSPSVGRITRRGAAATHLPVRMNGSVGFAKSRKSNARHAQTRRFLPSMTCRSSAIYVGPTQMDSRSLWASIQCLRKIPVGSWPQISTRENGNEMYSLLGRPVSVTKFLLLLSGLDPETAPTPGFSSRSRYRQRRRAVSEHSWSLKRWTVSPTSGSDRTIGFFLAKIQCRRVDSVI